MDLLFLDANVLFSAAYRRGAGLLRIWELPKVRLVSSAYAIEEARRNLQEWPQLQRLDKLLVKLEITQAQPPDRPIRGLAGLPSKDRPIMLAAITVQATHLLTGDFKHFGKHYGRAVEGVIITAPGDYLAGRAE